MWLILIWIDVDTWDVKKKRFYWNFDRNVINLQGLYAILRLGVDKKKIEIPERFIITRWLFQTENKKRNYIVFRFIVRESLYKWWGCYSCYGWKIFYMNLD